MIIDKNSSIPFHKQLQDLIISQIKSGELKPGAKIPSERELSDIYGVSRATSKNAVLALLNERIVIRTPGKGTFICEEINLTDENKRKHKNIGFVLYQPKKKRLPIEKDPVFMSVFGEIQQYSYKMNNHMMFLYVDEDSPEEIRSFRALIEKIDGVVLGAVENETFMRILDAERLPYVLAFPRIDIEGKVVVDFDHRNAGEKSVAYLIEKGHKKIALINGPMNDRAAKLRFYGFKEAFKKNNIQISDEFICNPDGWHVQDGYNEALKLFEKKELPTAIACANDLLAVGVLKACEERKIKVPEKLSIIGCDNTELSEHSIPSLTSVDTYRNFLGKLVAEQLYGLIKNPDFPPIKTIMPVQVIERNSVREMHT